MIDDKVIGVYTVPTIEEAKTVIVKIAYSLTAENLFGNMSLLGLNDLREKMGKIESVDEMDSKLIAELDLLVKDKRERWEAIERSLYDNEVNAFIKLVT